MVHCAKRITFFPFSRKYSRKETFSSSFLESRETGGVFETWFHDCTSMSPTVTVTLKRWVRENWHIPNHFMLQRLIIKRYINILRKYKYRDCALSQVMGEEINRGAKSSTSFDLDTHALEVPLEAGSASVQLGWKNFELKWKGGGGEWDAAFLMLINSSRIIRLAFFCTPSPSFLSWTKVRSVL